MGGYKGGQGVRRLDCWSNFMTMRVLFMMTKIPMEKKAMLPMFQ